MEETSLIKSENYKVKKAFIIALWISVILYFASFIIFESDVRYYNDYYNKRIEYWGERAQSWLDSAREEAKEELKKLTDEGPALVYALNRALEHSEMLWLWRLLICFGGTQLIAGIIYLWLKSYELTITDKRAYGRTAFGRRVDLPVDSITAIGLGWLKSIKITTASGKISFLLIKNRDEMYEAISNIIVERQNSEPKSETVIKQEAPQSNADELKKYKELLDSGVITEEEFNAKKKQLLGL